MQPKKKMEVNDVIIGILILFGYCLQSCKVVLIDFQDIYMLGIISEFSLRFFGESNPVFQFSHDMDMSAPKLFHSCSCSFLLIT